MTKKISDEAIIKSYRITGSVWKTGKELGISGQSVHERLVRLGLQQPMRKLTDDEKEKIKKLYETGFIRGDGKLKNLSITINRTIPFISRYARKIGLTNLNRKASDNTKYKNSIIAKEWIKENGHPRGMLNKHHTFENRMKIKERVTIHGLSNSRIYETWSDMKARCYNPNCRNYKHYGARGIKVCDEWFDFITFNKWAMENGYREDLTIDRIDFNGNYEPSNCRWATVKQQARNKRTNRFMSYKGEVHCISEWAEILQMPYSSAKEFLLKNMD